MKISLYLANMLFLFVCVLYKKYHKTQQVSLWIGGDVMRTEA